MRLRALVPACLLLCATRAESTELRLRLHGAGQCPTSADLSAAVHRRLADVPELSRSVLRLDVWRSGHFLKIALRAGSVEHHRTVGIVDSACAEVVETVAILVRSWIGELPTVAVAAVGPHLISPIVVVAEPTPPEAHAAAMPVASEVTVLDAGAPPIAKSVPSPPPELPSPQVMTPSAVPALSRREVEPTAVSSSGVPQPSRRASVLVSGGGAVGGVGTAAAGDGEGSLLVDVLLARRWHAALGGSVLSSWSSELSTGSLSASRVAVLAVVGFELLSAGLLRVDAVAGARFEIWSVQAEGFSVTHSQTVLAPGGTLGARARLELGWRLYPFASLEGNLLALPAFGIKGVDATVDPPLLWTSAQVGVGVWLW